MELISWLACDGSWGSTTIAEGACVGGAGGGLDLVVERACGKKHTTRGIAPGGQDAFRSVQSGSSVIASKNLLPEFLVWRIQRRVARRFQENMRTVYFETRSDLTRET